MLDVVRVVALLAVTIVTIAWLGGLFRADTVVEPEAVDYEAVARGPQVDSGFALLVPARLPDGWRATSARWGAADRHWHIGILTAEQEYVGVEQSRLDAQAAQETYAPGATEAGAVQVSGRPWVRLVDEQTGALALLDEQPEYTVVVTGSAPETTLAVLAETLAPVPPR